MSPFFLSQQWPRFELCAFDCTTSTTLFTHSLQVQQTIVFFSQHINKITRKRTLSTETSTLWMQRPTYLPYRTFLWFNDPKCSSEERQTMGKATITTGQGGLDVFIWRQFRQVTKCCDRWCRSQHAPSDMLNILPSNFTCLSNTITISHIYTVFKKTRRRNSCSNFINCSLILKILSLTKTAMNYLQNK